ncbi:ParA family protein [Rhodococcus qingshengii]|uniref:ParA family protein n=1 Tax=Rhodococcus qingshengii TaxID=334542 RepID=UPI001F128D64|nr:ParA family protein [Rhodococcus qingshengii]MDJ0441534.1 ParA family protein [Rhodococcus qingshengii]ULD45185.1 ParA family protein [Rhodococcus qingshengii]
MSTLAIEITSERTALVSGAGDEKVELSAENGQSIHAVIAQFSRQHSADAGSPVEVTVQEAGRSRQLTVAPDGKVAQSLPTGPIPAPADTPQTQPDHLVDEPVTMAVTPLGGSPPPVGADTHARPVPAARTSSSASVLAAPEIAAGSHEPARTGLRGRLNTLLNLRIAPKPESAEMRHRAAIASITGPLPGFSIVTIANPKGGVGKTPLAVGLNAIIAEHRGAATTVCVDVADVGGSLADRVSILPRDGHDVRSLLAAETAEPGSIRPSALSQYLTRQPGGDDIVAGNNGAHGSSLGYDDAHAAARILSQHREILIADTGNNRLAGSWRWATSHADVLLVPVPLRRDAAAAAHRMLLDLAATAGPAMMARTIVVITDGPGDAPMVEIDAVDAFLDAGVHSVARMPFEPLFASGERISPSKLRRSTTEALTVVASTVIDLIAHAAD